MRAVPTTLPEVLIFEPQVFSDARGFFFESFNSRRFAAMVGREISFVQDNHSRSKSGVLRGIHYQLEHPQGKLVRVVAGEVFDVAVDLRRSSQNFGKWFGVNLSADNRRQFWIPEGFGHAFVVLSESAEFLYKTTDYWFASDERTIRWDDKELGIDWPLAADPMVSAKDEAGASFLDAEVYA